jgi:hypothetical protein
MQSASESPLDDVLVQTPLERAHMGTVVRLGRVTGVEMSAERSRQAHRAARVPQVGR